MTLHSTSVLNKKSDEKIKELESKLKSLTEKNQKKVQQTDKKNNQEFLNTLKKGEADTRQAIAKVFIYGFFWLIGGSILVILYYNYLLIRNSNNDLVISLIDILPIVGSIVGSPLGFIVGYYFKDEK